MKITGYIPEPKVIGGLFYLSGTHGLPLEFILDFLKDRNLVMDWQDYIKEAIKDGHKISTVKARIISAVGDVYGCKYREEVEKRLDEFTVNKSSAQ